MKLYAAIVHVGANVDRGHYKAYVCKGDAWYNCDDKKVNQVSCLQDMTQNIENMGVMLFYKPQATTEEEWQSIGLDLSIDEDGILDEICRSVDVEKMIAEYSQDGKRRKT